VLVEDRDGSGASAGSYNVRVATLGIVGQLRVWPLEEELSMLRWRTGLLLTVAACMVTTNADAQGFSAVINSPIITGPPVTYYGCVEIDTTACAWFSFAYLGPAGLDRWAFTTPSLTHGASGRVYHFFDNWGVASSDGSCIGGSFPGYFPNNHCAVLQRYDLEWRVQVLYFGEDFSPLVTAATFSVTPEPATLLLVASGAAGLGALAKRRRKRAPKGST
jgi:hypothetical protein